VSTQRYISTSFWDDPWISTLDPSEKLLYLYLMTNTLTNISGVYKIAVRRICFDTGFNSDTVGHIMTKFETAKKAHRIGEYVALPAWPKHQNYETRSKIKDGITACLKELPKECLLELVKIGYRFDLRPIFDTLSIPYPYDTNYSDSELDIDSDSDIDSTPENPASPPEKLYPSETYTLADLLSELHTQNIDPGYRHCSPTQNQRWAGDIEKLNRLDGRSFQDIEKAIRWIKTPGQFWAPNIMSGAKLREKFPTIWAQMSQRPGYSKPELKVNQRTTMLDLEE